MSSATSVTPAMRQYLDAKRQHRDAIVFFRMGDFYEMFYEDALVAARALDLTLTSRSKDADGGAIPMCGVPFHALDGYLARLVTKGFRVAICEQVEDPKKAKGLVRREVVRVVSPGTLTDAAYLAAREPAYLMAIVDVRGAGAAERTRQSDDVIGVALIDLSTGEFTAAEYPGPDGIQALADDIAVLRPREIVLPEASPVADRLPEIGRLQVPVTTAEPWSFELEAARRSLLEQLKAHGLEGFGLDGRAAAVRAAGGLVAYLRDTQKAELAHVHTIAFKAAADALVIDPITLEHLEVVTGHDGTTAGSLLHEIDRTVTSMGGRLLRGWLLRPLRALEPIRDRLDAVEELAFRATDRAKFREALKAVHDLERLVARVALGTAGPRDFVSLRQSLGAVPRIRTALADVQAPLLLSLIAELDDLTDVRDLIERTIVDEPPAFARDGGFTRDGVDPELDELKGVSRSGRQVIARMEEDERARTGIGSLKVRFNRVFGYYIEVSKSNLHAVPADYQRKQTIAGGERFTTPALKDYEATVLGAEERILERELEMFERLRSEVAAQAPRIQDTARSLATFDVLAALAETAAVANFTKPHVHDGDELLATDARHPVVERHASGAFVPNDIDLNGSTRQLVILTGPNMGGKSTYLRQVALIPLLAQIGSFVPARDAKVPLVDRIFARVGASDNIARGQSTFMVEMQETANILHAATSRSLVVLDEIGRGTSTFDGLSIAWAVAEYLATNTKARPKTLFATHYHELTDLADAIPAVVNMHVSAREWKDDIIFLRKIVPGRSDRSYGIQVARLAGLPPAVVARAKEILGGLERDELSRGGRPTLSGAAGDPATGQLGLFARPADDTAAVLDNAPLPRDHEVSRRLRALDVDGTTPREALELVAELKKLAESD
ncbi:MAG: DNA mismatch repair protein MutS [Vicinamibacterales bacterium]